MFSDADKGGRVACISDSQQKVKWNVSTVPFPSLTLNAELPPDFTASDHFHFWLFTSPTLPA